MIRIDYLKTQENEIFTKDQDYVSFWDILKFQYYALPHVLITVLSSAIALRYGSQGKEFDYITAWAYWIVATSIVEVPHFWIVGAMHWLYVSLDPIQLKSFFGLENRKLGERKPLMSQRYK
jgi:hypothetical protein